VRRHKLRGGSAPAFRRYQSVRDLVVPKVGDDPDRARLKDVESAEGYGWHWRVHHPTYRS
jgi:hypothetical protein